MANPPKPKKKEKDLHSLISRLDALDNVLTVEGGKGGAGVDEDLDEFTRLKKNSAKMVAEIRKTISERDELLQQQGGGGTKRTIEMSAKVRSDIRRLKDTAEIMSELQRKEAARLDKKPLPNRKIQQPLVDVEQKGETVDLVWRHIEEVEALEKRRFQGSSKVSEDRAGLLSHSRSHAIPASATQSSLQDIDANTSAGLAMLKEKDQDLDKDLDVLSAGVKRLGNIALDMKQEINMQNVMIEEITEQVDKNVAHLQNLNAKLKDALEKSGGVQRFIVTIILVILLLAVGAYIIKLFMNSA